MKIEHRYELTFQSTFCTASGLVCVKYHEPPTLEIELNKSLESLTLLCLHDKTKYFKRMRNFGLLISV